MNHLKKNSNGFRFSMLIAIPHLKDFLNFDCYVFVMFAYIKNRMICSIAINILNLSKLKQKDATFMYDPQDLRIRTCTTFFLFVFDLVKNAKK